MRKIKTLLLLALLVSIKTTSAQYFDFSEEFCDNRGTYESSKLDGKAFSAVGSYYQIKAGGQNTNIRSVRRYGEWKFYNSSEQLIVVGYYSLGNGFKESLIRYWRQFGDRWVDYATVKSGLSFARNMGNIKIGFWKYYYNNGQLEKSGDFLNNKKEGTWNFYDNEGHLKEIVDYTKGKKNGKCKYFYESGQKKIEGYFLDNSKNGEWIYYSSNGYLEKVVLWENGSSSDNKIPYLNRIVKNANIKNKYLIDSIQMMKSSEISNILTRETKGEFEKEATYQTRITKLTHEITSYYNSVYPSLYIINHFDNNNNISLNFDSENEVFLIELVNYEPMYLYVPISEAREFNSNVKNLQFSNIVVDVTDYNGAIHYFIKEATIKNPVNSKSYNYDREIILNYNKEDIEVTANIFLAEAKREIPNTIEIDFYTNVNAEDSHDLFILKNPTLLKNYLITVGKKSIYNPNSSFFREKSDFESLVKYKKRINRYYDNAFDLDDLQDLIFDKYYPRIDFNITYLRQNEYDAEREVFKLMLFDSLLIYVHVPIEKAKFFKDAIVNKKLKVKGTPEFVFLNENSIALKTMQFGYKVNSYSDYATYDASNSLYFNNDKIPLLSNANIVKLKKEFPPYAMAKEIIIKDEDKEIFIVADELASYPDGQREMLRYIQHNLNYPLIAIEKKISGRVFTTLTIEKDGTISDIKIIRSLGGGCDEEAIRIVKSMAINKWKPAKLEGNIVRFKYNIPIKFSLDHESIKTITGFVSNRKGKPLSGVSVQIEGSINSTATNSAGVFSLQIPRDITSLIFNYQNIKNKTVQIDSLTKVRITINKKSNSIVLVK